MAKKLSQSELLKEIKEKSRLIAIQQAKANQDDFKDYGAAIGLQRLRNDRQALIGLLEPLKVISEGISCRDCRHYEVKDGSEYCNFYFELILCKEVRSADPKDFGRCGPEAKSFEPK